MSHKIGFRKVTEQSRSVCPTACIVVTVETRLLLKAQLSLLYVDGK